MDLRYGYLPAAAITDPELLTRMAGELPPAMRQVLDGVRFDVPTDSPAFIASVDAGMPPEIRRRYRVRELLEMGVSRKAFYTNSPLRRVADGRDGGGYFWFYATLVAKGIIG